METLQFIIIASAFSVFILLFIKYKKKPIISMLFSIVIILAFGLVIFYDIRETEDHVTAEIPEATVFPHIGKLEQENISFIKIQEKVLIDAPVIEQFPELPRGCEVTTLAMLLESAGVKADKMKLAEEVRKDSTERTFKNGEIHFGNPHLGFVGNMYTFSEPGLGVYHEPILELAEKYLPGKMVNLTGLTFGELKIPLSDGRPVWVIINSQYRELEDSYFQTWHTSTGKIRITMKEHSVLITGYDSDYIYFNDPLTGMKNKKAPIIDFEKSWVQMGSQALTFSY